MALLFVDPIINFPKYACIIGLNIIFGEIASNCVVLRKGIINFESNICGCFFSLLGMGTQLKKHINIGLCFKTNSYNGIVKK